MNCYWSSPLIVLHGRSVILTSMHASHLPGCMKVSYRCEKVYELCEDSSTRSSLKREQDAGIAGSPACKGKKDT